MELHLCALFVEYVQIFCWYEIFVPDPLQILNMQMNLTNNLRNGILAFT